MPELQQQWVCTGLHTRIGLLLLCWLASMGRDLVLSRQKDQ